MTVQSTQYDKTVAALIHLSTFSMFIFPLGNFVLPLVLWTAKKNDPFVNEHGKQALNFQISLFLYTFFLIMIAIAGAILLGLSLDFEGSFYMNDHRQWVGNPMEAQPVIIYVMIMLLLLLALIVLYIYATVTATVRAGEGKLYNYPLSINFLNAQKNLPLLDNSEETGEKEEQEGSHL